MKNLVLVLIYFLLFSKAFAEELKELPVTILKDTSVAWRLERINFYFENDLFFNTDNKYTSGVKLSSVYFVPQTENVLEKIPFLYSDDKSHFVSMGIAQQIFTPTDTQATKLLVHERPYAGWLYFEYGIHQSSTTELDSLVFEIGAIGKSSGAELAQTSIHKFRGIEVPKGWDNQLGNELGINLIYQHKWRIIPKKVYGISSNFIPFVSGSLGNVRTEAKGGVLMRFGWHPIADFGSSSIDIGGENGIPIKTNCLCPMYEPWSFTFNITFAGKAVARNIFLDGNTFSQSHSVAKEPFVGYTSLGMSARYHHFALDYMLTDFTKQYLLETGDQKYGSLLFSYVY